MSAGASALGRESVAGKAAEGGREFSRGASEFGNGERDTKQRGRLD